MDEFTYYPADNNCILKHVVYATDVECGVSVLILSDANQETCPFIQQRIKDFLKNQDCKPVILQTSLPGTEFLPLENDKNAFVMPHGCYLQMLSFFRNDWDKVHARIVADCKEMAGGVDLIPISPALSFKGPGVINYRCELGQFGKDVLYLVIQGNSKNNYIEIYFQLNLKINIDGVILTPCNLILLSQDFETIQNIVQYKCKKAKIILRQ